MYTGDMTMLRLNLLYLPPRWILLCVWLRYSTHFQSLNRLIIIPALKGFSNSLGHLLGYHPLPAVRTAVRDDWIYNHDP
jgi:hypothetical protein